MMVLKVEIKKFLQIQRLLLELLEAKQLQEGKLQLEVLVELKVPASHRGIATTETDHEDKDVSENLMNDEFEDGEGNRGNNAI